MENNCEIEFRNILTGVTCPICGKKILGQIGRGFSNQTHRRTNSNHLLECAQKKINKGYQCKLTIFLSKFFSHVVFAGIFAVSIM